MPNVDENIDWTTCVDDPQCTGVGIPSLGGKCLAHLTEHELSEALKTLSVERVLDARGVRLSSP
jgi:hypothetical protein